MSVCSLHFFFRVGGTHSPLRCENRSPIRSPIRSTVSETGLEMPGYGWKSLKVCLIDSNFRLLPRTSHHVTVSGILPPGVTVTETRIFSISKNLLGIRGWKSWNTDSLFQIYWGWNTDTLFLSHCCKRVGVNKDLLTNTFTQVDHERDMINWGQNTVILSVCFVHTDGESDS